MFQTVSRLRGLVQQRLWQTWLVAALTALAADRAAADDDPLVSGPKATVRGTVVDEHGQPAGALSIVAWRSKARLEAATDPEGCFQITAPWSQLRGATLRVTADEG